MPGHPDFQAFPQWIGDPLVQNAALAIGNGSHSDVGINVSNFASVIVAIKPTGGGITATLKQTIHNGPASLVETTSWTVSSGTTTFEQIILQGSIVELDLQGDTGGETVAYALYGSNTATSSQVSSVTTINFLHNGVNVKAEPGLDLEDAAAAALPGIPGLTWTTVDNAGVSVAYTPVLTRGPLLVTHDQVTAPVSSPAGANSEALATTIITTTSKTYDGVTPVRIEFFCPNLNASGGSANNVVLLRDSTVIAGLFLQVLGNASGFPLYGVFRETPTNAAHTYTVKWWRTGANTSVAEAGTGGTGAYPAIFLRVVYDI